jgi:CubicO group peptidase (beta-lactamase class C family)
MAALVLAIGSMILAVSPLEPVQRVDGSEVRQAIAEANTQHIKAFNEANGAAVAVVDDERGCRLTASDDQIGARLESLIPKLLTLGEVPGLSIAIVQKGSLVWHHGFGVKNSRTKLPVADDTVFEAASLSKPVFAYAVLKLVDEGRLDLDTPLNKYLPGRYDVGDDTRLNSITARHVLSHTTGFPNWRGRARLKIHFTPGERFSYSGEGFVYLGKVVEHVTGTPLESWMKQTVFGPLGMNDSSYVWQEKYTTKHASPHNMLGAATTQRRITKPNPAASLHTTAQDFGRFLVAMVNRTGLKDETFRQMLSPQIRVGEDGMNSTSGPPKKLSSDVSWGLGWGLQSTDDGTAFWHWGDNGNCKAFVIGDDKEKRGLVIFANSANGLSIVPEIVETAIGSRQPALAWMGYETYKSPAMVLFKKIIARGAFDALHDYRESRKAGPTRATLNEKQMNRLGYDLIAVRRLKDAIEVFKQNVADFPQSANVYDSLGEAYVADGNKEQALQNYQRALELDPKNTGAAEAIRKLRKNEPAKGSEREAAHSPLPPS